MLAIFDLDGTLFDTEEASSGTDVIAFQELGWRIPGGVGYIMENLAGQGSRDKFQHVAKLLNRKPDPDLYQLYRVRREQLNDDLIARGDFPVRPGVMDMLAHVQKSFTLAVATNNPTVRALAAIRIKGLQVFFKDDLVYTPERVDAKSKPDPAMLNLALAMQKAVAGDSVMVGDSTADMKAAKAAHIPALGFIDPHSIYNDTVAQRLTAAGATVLFSEFSPASWDACIDTLTRGNIRPS